MKNKHWNTLQYIKNKLGKTYSYKTTFADMEKDKKIKIISLPNSNVIVFPKKYVS